MMSPLLSEYKNGDYLVSIFEDGTLMRETEIENGQVEFPTSLDCKITNYCDQAAICGYCHEKSNTYGKHGDLELGLKFFKQLPAGTEIAIGGGNPLDHPDLQSWLEELKELGLIANLTVNSRHIHGYSNTINSFVEQQLIRGLGISWTRNQNNHPNDYIYDRRNVVYHLIAGIDRPVDLERLWNSEKQLPIKALILGYKSYGNGLNWKKSWQGSHTDKIIESWRTRIRTFLANIGNNVISFDNLAIEQLGIKDILEPESWNEFYMGDDGKFTMYVDLVNQQFCKSSVTPTRYDLNKYSTMQEIFQQIKK